MRHDTNELSFEMPPGLRDRTHHVLALGDAGPSPFTVVLSRNPVDPGQTLDTVVARIELELSRTLEDFTSIGRERTTVAGQPAVMIQFRWTQSGQRLFQKQAAFLLDAPDGRALMQVAATATEEASPDHAAGFGAMLASLRLRGADEG